MKYRLWVLLTFIVLCGGSTDQDYCERDENGSCKSKTNSEQCEDEDEPCFIEEKVAKKEENAYPHFETLSRLNPGKIGSEQTYTIGGREMKLITRALKPLLFEIPNALNDEEILHVIEKAKNPNYSGGMFSSQARGGLTPEDTFKPSKEPGRASGPASRFDNWDFNDDQIIDLKEVAMFCRNYNFLYFKEPEVKTMIETLKLNEFDDGICTVDEFQNMNTQGIEDYLNQVMRDHPKFRQRYSDQVWLPMAKEYDKLLSKIRYRFGELLKIPEKILLGSEHLQVVRYLPQGHYHAHHDSETEKVTDKPCCHHTSTKTVLQYNKCKLCRFITVMVYLNTPEEGGETAFPAADNITYSDSSFRRRGTEAIDLFNLSEHCQDANLVLKPVKGTAVVWYNHYVDYKGWLGALEERSLHGGCEVKKGEKWIMNIWITAPYKNSVNKLSMYSMEYAMSAAHNKD
ncbi:transmembrane prolyl 4-hydroxylase [Hydra vulgaris]|uniref:Transmembrane prolyl 4-hydroxylase n=1 Tax=Hydra vulgaris TaxID=6087 RepID=A0ABM4DPN7_HYDVU